MVNILICDDEKDIVNALKIYLSDPEYVFFEAYNGEDALNIVRQQPIDLILLDIMMPVMDGIAAMAKIREESNVPIILLTAKSEDRDIVLGLNVGADDYITKPFGMRELIARIKANIRRTNFADSRKEEPANVREFGNLEIDMNRYEARKGGQPLELTLREFELLRYLAERENKVFSREQLLEEVWGYEYYGDIRTVDVTVRRLREKLEDDPASPKYIMTKRGIGYYFRRP
jgi:two-component system response regulator VicR